MAQKRHPAADQNPAELISADQSGTDDARRKQRISRKILQQRSRIITETRNFFLQNNYLETDTPILSPAVIPEPSLHYFSTTYLNEFTGDRELYLLPSPEFYMKQLIAAGYGSIFQIGKCFRNFDESGRLHNPEFTMLEWYTVNADYRDSLDSTFEYFQHLYRTAVSTGNTGTGAENSVSEDLFKPFEIMTAAEAVWKHAGFDLEKTQRRSALQRKAAELNIIPAETGRASYTWEELFNLIFLQLVEPELPADHPVVITDYPEQIRCLAKKIPGTPWRERWELYIHGMELANCYTEETDPDAVDAFFQEASAEIAAERSHTASPVPDIDLHYKDLYTDQHPPCSGVALGIDRLVMELTGSSSLGGVLLFPFHENQI